MEIEFKLIILIIYHWNSIFHKLMLHVEFMKSIDMPILNFFDKIKHMQIQIFRLDTKKIIQKQYFVVLEA